MTEWTVVAGVDSSATASEIDTVANNIANVNIVGGISSDVTTVAGIASDVTSVSSISGNVTTVAGIDSNVTTVAGISGEITTVANDGTDIGIVAANTSNINTVAGISSNVTTVAGISSDVTTVAADETDIGTVATNIANINTTAGSISNVNTVATNIANINTVAADGTDIGVVAGISSDVTTVSGINANVTTVAGISADVTSVAGDATDIGTVATNIANVNTTAGSIANVNTVATNISNVNSVASNSTNIDAVAANETNINAVNSNSTNINTVASNNTNITTVATDIANVNTTASNITGVNSFAERYRVDSSDPTTSLDAGDLAFNTTDSALKYYNGTSWASITAGLTDIVGDVTPQLGGNLDLNSNDITGTGNIDTTGNLTISGDLTVNGTTTTINSTTISVDDKNIELGATASPTDLTADGGGITLKGTTDHTLNWINSTDAWTSSEHLNLATGKEYKINNTSLKDVSETLTNKTINSASNTITITESNISDLGSYLENVVEDTTPQLGGDLSTNGNDVNFGDNDKAIFGAGSDLQIYHDGSNSYVTENGVGNFYIQGQNSIRLTNSGGTENYAIFNVDGAVQLNHDNATRLLTTSTGVDVTGTVVSDGLTVDTNTLYVDATNNRVGISTSSPAQKLHLTTGGTTYMRVENTTLGCVTDFGTTSTGSTIINRSAHPMAFFTNSTERMRIDSSGNVGIGTSSPQSELHISGASTPEIRLTDTTNTVEANFFTNDTVGTIGSKSNHAFVFNTNNTERMRIDSSGNLGIGESSPSNTLHVKNTTSSGGLIEFDGQSNGEFGLRIQSNISGGNFEGDFANGGGLLDLFANSATTSGGDILVARTQASDPVFLVKGNGRVGIGTSSPARELHISDSGTPAIRIQDTGGTNQYCEMLVSGSAVILQSRNDTSDGNIVFRGLGGGIATEHMRINSSGNVGIGTTNPDGALTIQATGASDITYKYTDGTTKAFSKFDNSDFTFKEGTVGADAYAFFTNNTERMRIDSSGVVSIDSGYVTLNGNEIGGAQITIADDAVGTVVPPRNGGFIMMTTAGDTAFPNEPASAFLAYDVGSSLRTNIARSMDGSFDTAVEKTTGALTGTSATDGNIKVSINTGQIEINNRLGASVVIQLTFL
jgi:hypothetical protein